MSEKQLLDVEMAGHGQFLRTDEILQKKQSMDEWLGSFTEMKKRSEKTNEKLFKLT